MFHAMTGCDIVSFFLPAKEMARHDKFGERIQRPNTISCLSSVDLVYWTNPSEGRFVVQQDQLNDEGWWIKTTAIFKRNRGLEIIPPTQTALSSTFCVQRTNFSALKILEKCTEKKNRLLDSTAWGWQGDRHLKLASPGLAESPSPGQHDADSERQLWLSLSTTRAQLLVVVMLRFMSLSYTSRACSLLFILFLCLFLYLWPFQLCFIPYILPTTLRFLTLFFRSYFCLIGPSYHFMKVSPSPV